MNRSIKGTEIKVGMTLIAYDAEVVAVTVGQLPQGANYADVIIDSHGGETIRCWEGFLYRVQA